ncbi:MAG: hypothetical protein ACD_80C00097G0010 [uncultured bacterium (gcode 4)]|uniref:Uncharacterized protein n=1 Tax=uncultured bacterium (gcode 4) TaxID=1234023 RepID=K1XY28_9BACT|nr:MAG: hypothetical protein ACD_80C00097G0010 [uncultured bacterium (gcode 4)]
MANKAKNIFEFKRDFREKIERTAKTPWSERFIEDTKSAMFKAMVANPEYQRLKKEYFQMPKSERMQEKKFQEAFADAHKVNHHLDEDDFRKSYGESK